VDAPPFDTPTADVAIVGGGLAGLATALQLAREGVDVVLFEARASVGAAATGRQPGLASLGVIEHHWRQAASLGEQAAAALFGFCREGRALVEDLGLRPSPGLLWAADNAREVDDLRRSADVLRRLGHRCDLLDRAALQHNHGVALQAGLWVHEEYVFDGAEAASVLAVAGESAGVRIRCSSEVTHVVDDGASVRIHLAGGSCLASVVVFAANAWLPSFDPYFVDRVTPVREQALRFDTGTHRLPTPAGRAGQGYTQWRQRLDGSVVLAGCRWATPHLEVGETDDTRVVTDIQARLEAFRDRAFPAFAGAPVLERWSWITGHTCDGLPLVGPFPGDPVRVACAGFNGNQPGFALRAARAVADGLLRGVAPGVPKCLRPDRML